MTHIFVTTLIEIFAYFLYTALEIIGIPTILNKYYDKFYENIFYLAPLVPIILNILWTSEQPSKVMFVNGILISLQKILNGFLSIPLILEKSYHFLLNSKSKIINAIIFFNDWIVMPIEYLFERLRPNFNDLKEIKQMLSERKKNTQDEVKVIQRKIEIKQKVIEGPDKFFNKKILNDVENQNKKVQPKKDAKKSNAFSTLRLLLVLTNMINFNSEL